MILVNRNCEVPSVSDVRKNNAFLCNSCEGPLSLSLSGCCPGLSHDVPAIFSPRKKRRTSRTIISTLVTDHTDADAVVRHHHRRQKPGGPLSLELGNTIYNIIKS